MRPSWLSRLPWLQRTIGARIAALLTSAALVSGLTGCDYWPPALQSEIAELRTALHEAMDERLRLSQEVLELKGTQEAMLKEVEDKARTNRQLEERIARLTSRSKSTSSPSGHSAPSAVQAKSTRQSRPAKRDKGPAMRPPPVREVQTLLRRHDLPIHVDGVYGPDTRAAVRWFQRVRGLPIDGIVGPATYQALRHRGTSARRSQAKRLLRLTDPVQVGQDVKAVQRALRRAGHRIVVDGRYGPQTDMAVTRFQLTHRLTPDGRVGRSTWAALERAGR